jgi:nickel-type superoxide dismutase maturation protease
MNKPWRRVEVHGESMTPTLQPGDRLLVVAWPRRLLKPGHLVAVRRPERVVVKRIGTTSPFTVLGDNAGASTDSREFGPVEPKTVVGRAVYRYWPGDRAGSLR